MPQLNVLKSTGNMYFKNGDYFKAIKYYKEGLQLDPGNTILNCNLAQAYIALKEFEEAEVHALVALAHEPDSVKGHYRATKAALGMAKKERALSYLRTGLKYCPDSQELRTLYEDLTEESNFTFPSSSTKDERNSERKKIEEMNKISHNEKNGSEKQTVVSEIERPSRNEQNQKRSRSTSNRKRNRSKSNSNKANQRSISVNPSTSVARKNSISKVTNELRKDEFLDTLVKISSELSAEEKSPELRQREALMEKQKKLQTHMKEGSEALEIGLSKQASEKYKCALEIMAESNIEVFGLSEVDRIVLKYSLSICWIETKNYNNIVQSIGYFNEIESTYASILPAVYYGLGRAFCRLNRFKVALNHLEKGMNLIENCDEITPHPWPGTMKTIAETTKEGLLESIDNLQHECKSYCDPDAVCRYKECLKISSHICPSEIIFLSDPDFVGYVVIICQENCRITYHIGCWKHYKENLSLVKKFSDKDVLGQVCLTSDCLNERNEISLIVRVEIYGEDGEIKTYCSKEPTKTDNVNEHRKEKKKKNNEKVDKPVKIRNLHRVRRIAPCVLNSPKKVKRKTNISSDEFFIIMQQLENLRNINFGFGETSNWNPRLDYFGRSDIFGLETYLDPYVYKDSEVLRKRKDVIFTYFYEFLNDEGPQKISTVEEKWKEDRFQFQNVNEFLSQHDGICDFLIQSYRFACIDDYLCLVHHVADTYKRVQEEVGESITFILNNSSPPIDDETSDDNLEMNKHVENLSDNSKENNFRRTYLGSEQIDSAVASTSGIAQKRVSEYVFTVNQGTSESSSDVENDYDAEVVTNSDDEDDNDFEYNENLTCNEDVKTEDNIETRSISEICSGLAHYTNDFTLECLENSNIGHTNISEISSDLAHRTCDFTLEDPGNSNIGHEFQKVDLKNVVPIISDVPVLKDDAQSSLVLRNVSIQTDSECYLEMKTEIEILKKENQLLKQKAEVMKKKHHEEVHDLTKKREEDTLLLKNNLENMTELNKEIEKKANAIDCVEAQLRRSNEQILNLRKQIGEYTLDSYLGKCQERLQCMNAFISKFEEIQSSGISEIKAAAEKWEVVARNLRETKDLLQVQHEILSQQIKSKISSDCLLQLQLTDLPKEPFYPLQDVDNILRLVVEYVQLKNNKTVNVDNSVDNAATLYSPFFDVLPSQPNGNLDDTRLLNAYGPPVLSSNLSTFSRPMRTSADYHFNSYQLNQNFNSTVTPPSEFQSTALKNNKYDDAYAGERLHFSHLGKFVESSKSVDTSLSRQPKAQTSNEASNKWDAPVPLMELKLKDPLGEKRGKLSCVAGLTPIETLKSGVLDVKGSEPSIFKSEISELKQNTQKCWNYVKLLEKLQEYFKFIPKTELIEFVSVVRAMNGNKLTGLTVVSIRRRVGKLLEGRSNKKVGNMGMDKFGGTAWGEVKKGDVSWQNEDPDDECIICHISIERSRTSLQCKHVFHTECIRKWLHTNSTCPICRKFTKLDDEFPPLG